MVEPLDEIADNFTTFLATFIAALFVGLEDFEPLALLPRGRGMLQTPGFWHQQLCYAMSHMDQAIPNYLLLRLKRYRTGRVAPGRAPFQAYCSEAWQPFQAIYLFLPVQIAIRMAMLFREGSAHGT